MRSVVFVLILFAFLVSGGASSLASGGEKKAAPAAHGGEESAEEGGKKDKKEPEEVTGGRFEGDPVYVHLTPVILPVISDLGAEQLVNLIVDLETRDVDTAMKLNTSKPRLKDAVIRALYGGLSDGSMRNANALDIDRIKDNIRLTINATYGEGTVLDVLIQAVEQRKF